MKPFPGTRFDLSTMTPERRQEINKQAGSATTAKKAAAVRRNGCAPVKPGSRPRGRPKKQLPDAPPSA